MSYSRNPAQQAAGVNYRLPAGHLREGANPSGNYYNMPQPGEPVGSYPPGSPYLNGNSIQPGFYDGGPYGPTWSNWNGQPNFGAYGAVAYGANPAVTSNIAGTVEQAFDKARSRINSGSMPYSDQRNAALDDLILNADLFSRSEIEKWLSVLTTTASRANDFNALKSAILAKQQRSAQSPQEPVRVDGGPPAAIKEDHMSPADEHANSLVASTPLGIPAWVWWLGGAAAVAAVGAGAFYWYRSR